MPRHKSSLWSSLRNPKHRCHGPRENRANLECFKL